MPSNSYHCKYCHQRKATETSLNRHIAHSPGCYQAWQENLLQLTSTSVGVDTSINPHSATIDNLQPGFLGNDNFMGNDFDVDEAGLSCDNMRATTSTNRSEEINDVEDGDDTHSQSRYRKGYPGMYTAEILGKGKTKFEIWQQEQISHHENEWAPFDNQKEWDLAQWLIKNVGQKSMDKFLELPIVSLCTQI